MIPIFVEWRDHATYHGWKDLSQKFSSIKVRTLGWLISEDKDQLVVAPAYTVVEDDTSASCGEPTVILKSAVIRRYDIDMGWI